MTTAAESKSYRVRRVRNGATLTRDGYLVGGGLLRDPADETRVMLRDLSKKLSWRQISRLSGVSVHAAWSLANGKSRTVYPATAAKVRGMWDDYCGPCPRAPEVRLSVEPLVAHVNARFGSAWAAEVDAQMARFKREGLSVRQADKWAIRLDAMPHELWPEAFV